jgi:nicotinate-nucleotide--dimethylbenzimidazole phosphoribosyltransferase
VSRLDLDALTAQVERPEESARAGARERWLATGQPGVRGLLEDLGIWLAGAQGRDLPQPPHRVRAIVVAAEHGIVSAGVTRPGAPTTERRVRAVVDGSADVSLAAAAVGATVRLLDLRWDMPTGRIDRADAMSRHDAADAFRRGVAVADEEVDSGADVLVAGAVSAGVTTIAAALVGVLTRADAAAVTGRGLGIDDDTWMRKCAAVRDAMRRTRPYAGDPLDLLAVGGGPDLAALTGLLVQAAVRRTPVIIDGVASAAAALLAHRIAFRAADWWLAGHRVDEPAHALALERLALAPLLEARLRHGDGTGGLLAVPMLRTAASVLQASARTDRDP